MILTLIKRPLTVEERCPSAEAAIYSVHAEIPPPLGKLHPATICLYRRRSK